MPASAVTSASPPADPPDGPPDGPPDDEELLDQLVPGPSPLRRVLVVLAVGLLGFGLLVVPNDDFQSSWKDWRHIEELAGQLRVLEGPIKARSQAPVVALGDGRVLVWGGRRASADSGAVYDPATGTWTDLPRAPGPSRFAAAAVWTGQEALIWGGSTRSDELDFHPGGVAWNPTTGRWRTLPLAPFSLMHARAVAFDGGVLFTGGKPQEYPSEPASLWLDLSSGAWSTIDTPVSVVNTARMGDRLLATGPPELTMGLQPVDSWPVVVFDPGTRTWAPFADPLVTEWMALAVADDGTVSAVTVEGLDNPLRAYVWTGARWELAAESQRAAPAAALLEYVGYPVVAAWTGKQLLVGGNGGLVGWDPQRRVLSHRSDMSLRTFGGSAVWTGKHLVRLTSQDAPGWQFTPA